MRKGQIAIVVFLAALLIAAAWYAYDGFVIGGDATVSMHAYIAMALGIFFSIVIGGGLMALLFFSSRRGYDEPPKLLSNDSGKKRGTNAPL